jgi:hypothetical protein
MHSIVLPGGCFCSFEPGYVEEELRLECWKNTQRAAEFSLSLILRGDIGLGVLDGSLELICSDKIVCVGLV